MRLRLLISALIAVAILAGCGKPMENKDLNNPARDSTSKAMKAAGGGDE
jgi:hypothetical protein